MRKYFDEEEEPEAGKPRRDTEVTLGAGAMVGACLALVLVCIVCFGWGYAVGHRSPVTSPAKAASSTPAPDQEPLQGNDTIPKPSAADTTAASQNDAATVTPLAGTSATGQSAATIAQGQTTGRQVPGAAAGSTSQQVQPAAGNVAPTASAGSAPNSRIAAPNQLQLMVQVAAVAHVEDAQVLVAALRKRGYPVMATRDPVDGLIHVRIGPFSSQDEAIRWRDKLLGDGYNAQLQQ